MQIKKIILLLLLAVIVTITYKYFNLNLYRTEAEIQNMNISTKLFKDGGFIPEIYTCDGEDARISLKITDVPENSKSLVVIVSDPDAPSGNYIHWIVWNIPPRSREIEGDLLPEGAVEGKNSANKIGWISPCPPAGTHHYNFILYALDNKLSLPESSKYTDVKSAMEGHIIREALLVGLYQRKLK